VLFRSLESRQNYDDVTFVKREARTNLSLLSPFPQRGAESKQLKPQ